MAEKTPQYEQQVDQPKQSLVGQALDAGKAVVTGIRAAAHPILKDGTIEAAFRQGADEIGAALKAFPDSIQCTEIGSILNPTSAEIARESGVFDRDQQPDHGLDAQAMHQERGGRGR
jgi:hypothetical protein